MTTLTLIAALAENRVIGDHGAIPWSLPGELAHFKATTMGHTMLMGRATFEGIGRVLPGRRTIVLTRDPGWQHSDVEAAASLPEALALAGPVAEVFVAGGGQVYAAALPLADRMILTHVPLRPAGDAFFPEVNWEQWRVRERWAHPAYTIVDYARIVGADL